MAELISKATRNEFREVLSGFVLRKIDMIFEGAGFEARRDFQPAVGGERRTLVEQYYAGIDFSSATDVRKLIVVFEEVLEHLFRVEREVSNPADVQATIETLLRRMERDGFRFENGRFVADPRRARVIEASSLIALTEESIMEQVEKVRAKIESGDYSGAIASSYTLLEGFLKELLRRSATPFNEHEGDVRELYRVAMEASNWNPKGESLESYLKMILQGLKNQVSGLYELANNASDRHARRYNPARHHAKLAVNATLTLCEFLLDSFEYQQKRKDRGVTASER
jgi:hypothetical protein